MLTSHPSRICSGVLAGKLRSVSFQPVLLSLEPRLSRPRALEIVADLDMQPAERLGFELDDTAVLERIQAVVFGPMAQHVPRLVGVDQAAPFKAAKGPLRST